MAVAYLNRILFLKRISTNDLQALASACLFIASKMKAPQPLIAKRLSEYTDEYVSVESILVCYINFIELSRFSHLFDVYRLVVGNCCCQYFTMGRFVAYNFRVF